MHLYSMGSPLARHVRRTTPLDVYARAEYGVRDSAWLLASLEEARAPRRGRLRRSGANGRARSRDGALPP
jgi:hypothetical protein